MTTTTGRTVIVHDQTAELGLYTLTSDSPGSISLSEAEYAATLRVLASTDLDAINQTVQVGPVTIRPMGANVYRVGRTDNVLSNILTDLEGLRVFQKVARHYSEFGFFESISTD
jgi:hypothetical protein